MHEIITTWDSIKDGVNAFVDCSKPIDGKIAVHIERYNPTKAKTLKQLNTFYSLATEFFTSGCSSFESLENLKDYYKNQIGLIRYYKYFKPVICEKLVRELKETCLEDTWGLTEKEKIENAKQLYEKAIRENPMSIRKPVWDKKKNVADIPTELKQNAIKVLDSFANAKRKQLTDAIKILIAEMINSGVNTKGFERIMKGLEGEYNYE